MDPDLNTADDLEPGDAQLNAARLPACSVESRPSAHELALAETLSQEIWTLAEKIGPRNPFHPEKMRQARRHIAGRLKGLGYELVVQSYTVTCPGGPEVACKNVIAERKGRTHADEIVVVGAHYDTVRNGTGANDNASGVAALIAIAENLACRSFDRTLRFAAFCTEEPPFLLSTNMGSLRYAAYCKRAKENIVGAVILDSIGCAPPGPKDPMFEPSLINIDADATENCLAIIANSDSESLGREAAMIFSGAVDFPFELGICPHNPSIADQWPFWLAGYPAILAFDIAVLRDACYHTPQDSLSRINLPKCARVTAGMQAVVASLAGMIPGDAAGM